MSVLSDAIDFLMRTGGIEGTLLVLVTAIATVFYAVLR